MTPKLAESAIRADIKALGDSRRRSRAIMDLLNPGLSRLHPPQETVLSAAQPNMKGGSCKGSQETHNKLTGQSESLRLASAS
jgi:hypothetical protein